MSPDRIRPGSAGRRGGVPEEPATPQPPALDDASEAALEDGNEPADEALSTGVAGAEELGPEPHDENIVLDENTAYDEGALLDESPVLDESPLAPPPTSAVRSPARRTRPVRSGRAARDDAPVEAAADAAPLAAAPTPHRRLFTRVYYGETRIDFVRRKRIWFLISTVVILAGVISLATRGLNLGIEFVGGTSWTVSSKTLTVAATQNAIGASIPNAQITILGSNAGGSRQIQVEAKLPKGQGAAAQTQIANTVAAELAHLVHGNANEVSTESVGPSWGGQITQKAVVALIVFFILIALYISIFFEWRMAIAAIIAVAHDVFVTVGIYSLSGFEVTPDTVVAFLTILGYSLYDTIVVFDRIRDNVKNLSVRDRLTFSDVVNLSMNQTLARSINTSLVAIMPILAVLVLGAEFLGASTLQYFGLALLVGLATGAYSSIFIASPLVALMKEREPRYRQLRERLIARGSDRILLSAAQVATGSFGEFANTPGPANGARGRRQAPVSGRIVAGSAASNGERGVASTAEGDPDGTESSRPAPRPRPARPGAAAAARKPSSRSRKRGGRR